MFRVYCDPTYLEPQCVKSVCTPRDDESGHYFCNNEGKKVCLDGWKNVTSGCLEGNILVNMLFVWFCDSFPISMYVV